MLIRFPVLARPVGTAGPSSSHETGSRYPSAPRLINLQLPYVEKNKSLSWHILCHSYPLLARKRGFDRLANQAL
eukprot:4793260-Amphidinium_carterae.1